ncbi:hypothetical protein [Morganella morganii]|uniref:hypothetical protein n=1 Tax=Morganella morganii TaxID=582 RepID=UPI0034E51543
MYLNSEKQKNRKTEKQKNRKTEKQKNESAKSSALWQGGKGRIPGSIHQYVTGVAERSQRSHRPEDDADSDRAIYGA